MPMFLKGLAKLVTKARGIKVNKDKGKGKEAKPLSEAKDPKAAPKLKDATVKVKEAEVRIWARVRRSSPC